MGVQPFADEYKTTKKPTNLIGSFALFLAVPTGFEPAERNWYGGWFSMCSPMIVLCHLCDVKHLGTTESNSRQISTYVYE
jgi:hypothetical protein